MFFTSDEYHDSDVPALLMNWHEYPHSLTKAVPNLDNRGLDLLWQMLQYEPSKRISAKKAMDHPYFDGLDKICDRINCPLRDRTSLPSKFLLIHSIDNPLKITKRVFILTNNKENVIPLLTELEFGTINFIPQQRTAIMKSLSHFGFTRTLPSRAL
uniref:Uncharacterized protein n=1 Tax=Cannabis sativa TaxID=3483 RepID=A0A803NIB4_CANSA